MRSLLPGLAVSTLLACVACGSAPPPDLGPDTPGNANEDGGGNGSSGGTVTDGGSTGDGGGGSSGGTDATTNDGGTTDATPPAPDAGFVTTKIEVTTLSESCIQVIETDPVSVVGAITLTNGTPGDIGPIKFPSAAFLSPTTFDVIATFDVGTVTLPVLGAGATGKANFQKTAGSSNPANRCSTLPCGKQVIVQVTPEGSGVPSGAQIRTDPITVSCSL